MKFIERPISNKALLNRSLIHKIGFNDSDYSTSIMVDGKKSVCPYYARWAHMLERCYSKPSLLERPTYKDCYVCKEWLVFSAFRSWMIKQKWKGKHLDKDILIQGSKVYSPESCLFVSATVNQLVNTSPSTGKLKRGVCFDKRSGLYKSTISVNNKTVNLGYFHTEYEASECYKAEKYIQIRVVASKQDKKVKAALLRWKIID